MGSQERDGRTSRRTSLVRWRDAAGTAPRLVLSAVRHGILPVGLSALWTLRREGAAELHWKVLGDALVRFFRDAGPVLAKVGQVLATRSDLMPEAVCARLEALYTDHPAMPKAEVKRALLRAYPERRPFRRFDYRPLAVGSIGQVHRARLRDGTRVVVKLARPGIDEAIRRDLNAARVATDLFFTSIGRNRRVGRAVAARMLEDLAEELVRESDLGHEADAFEEFGRRFAKNPRVCVPTCYRQWSTREVLVLEELRGEPLSAVRERARSDPEAARRAADLALKEILRQVFDEGRFHADPHAGNLLILEDGRLGILDLGLTGELGDRDRRIVARAVRAFLARDPERALRALLEFGTLPEDFDLAAFRADVQKVFAEHGRDAALRAAGRSAEAPSDSSALEKLVDALFGVAHRHQIQLAPSTTLLIKTLVTIEGVARSLDPRINVVVAALPIILRSLAPPWLRWRPRGILGRVSRRGGRAPRPRRGG
jgi:ubiquinone biosynthesis protein